MVKCGNEILFQYHDKTYGIASKLKHTPESNYQILISQIFVENSELAEKWCNTADEVLQYVVNGTRLRDIITKVNVTFKAI